MAGKPRGLPANDAFVTLRLSRELYDRLSAAAQGRSVSAEIRSRLMQSFMDPADLAAFKTLKEKGFI